jgi:hypothetical protein
MTAEVAILNRVGVSLAADSAATVLASTRKTFTSAEKLFNLVHSAPVGIMIYGNSSLLTMPWETIIKDYRRKCRNKTYPKLQGYAKDFLKYIENNKRWDLYI